ncbi:hypothetical protein D3C80_1479420 [compost metagenome]
MAGDVESLEAVTTKQAGLQKLQRTFEITPGDVEATGQQKRLSDASIVHITADPVFQRCLVADEAGGNMRHHRVAVFGEPFCRRDHVLDRRAVDMGDIDAHSGRQEFAKILDLGRGARHDLDRIAVEKCAETCPLRFLVCSPVLEKVQNCHIDCLLHHKTVCLPLSMTCARRHFWHSFV